LGQVIAVVSGKGGTGKSSFTALAGLALSRLGQRVLLIDGDIGLRNLDLYLGLSDRALMDYSDVIEKRATLLDAAVQHPDYPNLYLLTAPVSLNGKEIEIAQMQSLLREVRTRFDYCLIDSAAGLGRSFILATCGADRVIVVANTEPSSLRDAQRTVMELKAFPQGSVHLVINRLRKKLLQSLHSNIDDAMDAAGLPLLGVIPEDENIPSYLSCGKLIKLNHYAPAYRAAENTARRLCGEHVRLMKL